MFEVARLACDSSTEAFCTWEEARDPLCWLQAPVIALRRVVISVISEKLIFHQRSTSCDSRLIFLCMIERIKPIKMTDGIDSMNSVRANLDIGLDTHVPINLQSMLSTVWPTEGNGLRDRELGELDIDLTTSYITTRVIAKLACAV